MSLYTVVYYLPSEPESEFTMNRNPD